VGLDEKGDTILTHQLFWPKDFITEKSDSKGKKFGDKTCTLETIGVLLPFLLLPERLKNQHVVCRVDCMGVVYGWENKKSKDKCASMLIKALHIIEAYLGSRIHVVPRMSALFFHRPPICGRATDHTYTKGCGHLGKKCCGTKLTGR
jgi:hypothetical protein